VEGHLATAAFEMFEGNFRSTATIRAAVDVATGWVSRAFWPRADTLSGQSTRKRRPKLHAGRNS